jgi:hypothetical protein
MRAKLTSIYVGVSLTGVAVVEAIAKFPHHW